jgi:hypothetical protein
MRLVTVNPMSPLIACILLSNPSAPQATMAASIPLKRLGTVEDNVARPLGREEQRGVADELAKYGITVNAVMPGNR